MKKSKLITLALCAFALVGCGNGGGTGSSSENGTSNPSSNTGPKENVELTLWGPSAHNDLLKDMAERFKQANPDKNYTINVGVCGEADAKGNVTKDVEAAADVYGFANDQLVDLVRAGGLAQVGGAYKQDVINSNMPTSVTAASIGDKLYGYPYAADNGYFMYYNKAVLGNTTGNLNDILDLCAAQGKKFTMSIVDAFYTASFFLGAGCSFNVEYDENLYEKTIECNFDNADGLVAGKAMMYLNGHAGFRNGKDADILAGFQDGSVVAAVSGTWNGPAIREKLGDNYAAVKLPTITVDGRTFQMGSFDGFKIMGVNPTSAHLADAHKLAAFITSESMQLLRFESQEIGPSNINAAATEQVKNNVAVAAVTAQREFATPQVSVPSNFWTSLEAFGTEVNSGKVTESNLQIKLSTMVQLIKSAAAIS